MKMTARVFWFGHPDQKLEALDASGNQMIREGKARSAKAFDLDNRRASPRHDKFLTLG